MAIRGALGQTARVQLFFVINQHLLDGSAHALYCYRNCWWLAHLRPNSMVSLVHPGRSDPEEASRRYGLPALPNLRLCGLTAVRRPRGGRGITINLVYYWALYRHLVQESQPGDVLISASFPKLISFLRGRSAVRERLRWVYEVHDLVSLSQRVPATKATDERELLAIMDRVVTTTEAMATGLEKSLPKERIFNFGLACGFAPAFFSAPRPMRQTFVLGYVGSVYREQGVEWLIQQWPVIAAAQPRPVRLAIAGGTPAQAARLRQLAAAAGGAGIAVHGPVPPSELDKFLAGVDALVLPALPEGRMPYVAITKAYDYLGLNRPVLASGLPSITEIMRPKREAWVFEPGNAASLSAGLRQVIDDAALRDRLVRAAHRRAVELDWASRAKRYWAMLDGIQPR